jgi:hypothetical protein
MAEGVCRGCNEPATIHDGLNGYCIDCWRWLEAEHNESAERALEAEMAFHERDNLPMWDDAA